MGGYNGINVSDRLREFVCVHTMIKCPAGSISFKICQEVVNVIINNLRHK